MPRHIFGELSRTIEGCTYLMEKRIIYDLISFIKRSPLIIDLQIPISVISNSINCRSFDSNETSIEANKINLELRSAIWSIGHIASSDPGFSAVISLDPGFVEFCIQNICYNPNFSLRGTFFYALGLISRNMKAIRKLSHLNWEGIHLNELLLTTINRFY
jgi:hypothetical protein